MIIEYPLTACPPLKGNYQSIVTDSPSKLVTGGCGVSGLVAAMIAKAVEAEP